MNRKKSVGWQMFGIMAVTVIAATGAWADSATVSYQGVLRDAALAPVPDGTYPMRFSIWDDAAAGTKRWGDESHPAVATRNGLFSVYLGSNVALGNVFADYPALWLQIEADTGSGLEVYNPRVPLASVPYARHAVNADTVDGQHASAFAAASHNHDAGAITTGTLSTDRYSAYSDLSAESKIGAGGLQVAAGNHTHNTLSGPSGSPSNVVVVNSAGNVGIGTAAPGAKLEVSGALKFTGDGAVGNQTTGQITRAPRVIRTGLRPGLSGCPAGLPCGGVLMEQTFSLNSSAVVIVNGHTFRPAGSGWSQVNLVVDAVQQLSYRVPEGTASASFPWGGVLNAGSHTIQVTVSEAGCGEWGCASDPRFDYLIIQIFE